MTSFIECIQANIANGSISPKQVERLKKSYDAIYKKNRETMSDADATARASQAIVEREIEAISLARANRMRAAIIQKEMTGRIDTLAKKNGGGAKAYRNAISNELEYIEVYGEGIFNNLMTIANDFAAKFKPDWAGLKSNHKGIYNVVRELSGESTGDSVSAAMAKGMRQAMDAADNLWQGAGGALNKIENYVPQRFSRDKFVSGGKVKVDFGKWYDDMLPLLDRDKMIDFETGAPLSDSRLTEVMGDIYQDIVTEGNHSLSKLVEGGQRFYGGKAIQSKRDSRRFFRYKDAESWIKANDMYGVGEAGAFELLVNHLRGYSKDIAVLQKLGPSFGGLREYMLKYAQVSGVKDQSRRWLSGQFDVVTGVLDNSVADPHPLATGMANFGTYLRSALLGSAVVSAISDTAFLATTAKLNGLSQAKVLRNFATALADSKDVKLAKNTAFVAEQINGRTLADARYNGDNLGGKISSLFANTTIEFSGLGMWTRNTKNAIGLEVMGAFANLRGQAWDSLDKTFRESLEAYNITSADWNDIGKIKPFIANSEGASFLTNKDILESSLPNRLELANKYSAYIEALRQQAANEPLVATRAITTGAAIVGGDAVMRGSVARVLFSSVFALKSFPITVMMRHIAPLWRNKDYGTLAAMIGTTTLLGGVALHAKDVLAGKEPREMDSGKFWAAAMMQGGGLGLFGDFLFADQSRFGNSLIASSLGPIAGTVEGAVKLTKGNLDKALQGGNTTFMRDTVRMAYRLSPGKYWYTKLALERMIFDQIEQIVDPNFHKNVARLEKQMFKDYGQKPWWGKGDLLPQ